MAADVTRSEEWCRGQFGAGLTKIEEWCRGQFGAGLTKVVAKCLNSQACKICNLLIDRAI